MIGKEIEKACQGIYPLQNVFTRKVKVLKAPKESELTSNNFTFYFTITMTLFFLDLAKLLEMYNESSASPADIGTKLNRPPTDFVEKVYENV